MALQLRAVEEMISGHIHTKIKRKQRAARKDESSLVNDEKKSLLRKLRTLLSGSKILSAEEQK